LFLSSTRRRASCYRDWSSDVCSSDLLPLRHRAIRIVVDDLAAPEFGRGVVKVTPAHDPNDFECGRRHKLPMIRVIDETGHMTEEIGRAACRERGVGECRATACWESWR